MKIYIASDHAGFELKNKIIEDFKAKSDFEVKDFGPTSYDENDDYPDFVINVAKAVSAEPESLGIVLGGSGQGEAMAVNRINGARALVFYGSNKSDSCEIVKLAREHNNANVISIGARFVTFEEAKNAIDIFLNTKFSNDERHIRRLSKF